MNIGVDLSLFNHLDITADYFCKNTSDVLLQVPITAIAGVDNEPWVNAGKVRNTGFEFSASWNGEKNGFTYNVYGNFSTIKNEVTSLGNGSEAIFGGSYSGTNITRYSGGR